MLTCHGINYRQLDSTLHVVEEHYSLSNMISMFDCSIWIQPLESLAIVNAECGHSCHGFRVRRCCSLAIGVNE